MYTCIYIYVCYTVRPSASHLISKSDSFTDAREMAELRRLSTEEVETTKNKLAGAVEKRNALEKALKDGPRRILIH